MITSEEEGSYNLGGKNNDQRDIFEIFAENGYTVVRNREDFEKLTPQSGKVVAINAVLDEDQALPYEIDREGNDLSLADFTRKGIELLDNPEGFFMLVEGRRKSTGRHTLTMPPPLYMTF